MLSPKFLELIHCYDTFYPRTTSWCIYVNVHTRPVSVYIFMDMDIREHVLKGSTTKHFNFSSIPFSVVPAFLLEFHVVFFSGIPCNSAEFCTCIFVNSVEIRGKKNSEKIPNLAVVQKPTSVDTPVATHKATDVVFRGLGNSVFVRKFTRAIWQITIKVEKESFVKISNKLKWKVLGKQSNLFFIFLFRPVVPLHWYRFKKFSMHPKRWMLTVFRSVHFWIYYFNN
jgi:hypothetical protein